MGIDVVHYGVSNPFGLDRVIAILVWNLVGSLFYKIAQAVFLGLLVLAIYFPAVLVLLMVVR